MKIERHQTQIGLKRLVNFKTVTIRVNDKIVKIKLTIVKVNLFFNRQHYRIATPRKPGRPRPQVKHQKNYFCSNLILINQSYFDC